MKNAKLLLVCVLGIVVFAAGMYITLSIVADNIVPDKPVITGTPETAAVEITLEPIDAEPDIEFTPIEETETESTNEETVCEVSELAVSEVDTEIQPQISEVSEYVTENVEQGAVLTQYTDDDLMLLARVIQNEAGADIATDEHQRAVASVVMNRVADPRFPDTVYGVITQGWNGECALQYAVGGAERFFSLVPTERAIANAQYVLTYGSTVADAVWQAEFVQGEIVAVFEYPGTPFGTTYICR